MAGEIDYTLLDLVKKIEKVDVISSRMDSSIGKLTEVSQCVSKLLAVHEEKFDHQQEFNKNIIKILEEREDQSVVDLEKIKKEITELQITQNKYYEDVNKKFNKFEKLLWLSGMSGVIIGFLIGNYDIIIKILT